MMTVMLATAINQTVGEGSLASESARTAPRPPHYGLLSSVTIPPGIEINPKGLVLIVGPNSAGKTQLLKDIQAVLIGQARDLVVCADYMRR